MELQCAPLDEFTHIAAPPLPAWRKFDSDKVGRLIVPLFVALAECEERDQILARLTMHPFFLVDLLVRMPIAGLPAFPQAFCAAFVNSAGEQLLESVPGLPGKPDAALKINLAYEMHHPDSRSGMDMLAFVLQRMRESNGNKGVLSLGRRVIPLDAPFTCAIVIPLDGNTQRTVDMLTEVFDFLQTKTVLQLDIYFRNAHFQKAHRIQKDLPAQILPLRCMISESALGVTSWVDSILLPIRDYLAPIRETVGLTFPDDDPTCADSLIWDANLECLDVASYISERV